MSPPNTVHLSYSVTKQSELQPAQPAPRPTAQPSASHGGRRTLLKLYIYTDVQQVSGSLMRTQIRASARLEVWLPLGEHNYLDRAGRLGSRNAGPRLYRDTCEPRKYRDCRLIEQSEWRHVLFQQSRARVDIVGSPYSLCGAGETEEAAAGGAVTPARPAQSANIAATVYFR